jgi:cell division protein FtsW (lipid II flippase)
MKLITAHKVLIVSATIFFVFFAAWELNRYSNSDDIWAMARSALYLLVALGFGIYLKNLKRWYR